MFKSIAVATARALPDFVRDLLAIGGASLIGYGAWLIYQPAGYIVAGVLLLAGLYLQTIGSQSRTSGG